MSPRKNQKSTLQPSISRVKGNLKKIDSLFDLLSKNRPKDMSVITSEPRKVDAGFYAILISREQDGIRTRIFGENISVNDVLVAIQDIAESLLNNSGKTTAVA